MTSESEPIKEPLKDSSAPDATNESSEQPTEAQPPNPNICTPIETDGQKTPCHYEITCKNEKNWWDKTKPIVEIAGLILLAIYTCETHRTNNLTQRALKISKQQFTDSQNLSKQQFLTAQKASTQQFDLDQRPWIGIVFMIQDFEKGKQPKFAVQFENTGRRPAKVSIAQTNSRTYKVFPEHPAYPREPGNITSADIIVPNATLTHSDTIDFPSDPELAVLRKFPRQETLYIYTSIDYEDVVIHASHWTHGCWQYYPEYGGPFGSWVNCAVYNEVDKEKQ